MLLEVSGEAPSTYASEQHQQPETENEDKGKVGESKNDRRKEVNYEEDKLRGKKETRRKRGSERQHKKKTPLHLNSHQHTTGSQHNTDSNTKIK